MKYLRENNIEFDNEISEEVVGFGEVLPKGNYVLVNDILNKEDEEIAASEGDLVMTFEDQGDTCRYNIRCRHISCNTYCIK